MLLLPLMTTLRGQSALGTEQVFHFLGPDGVCTRFARVFFLWFSYVTTLGTLYKPNTPGGARISTRIQGRAGVACSGKQQLGTVPCNLRLSSSLLELLMRLSVLLLLLIPGFHKALIADLRLVALCLPRGLHPQAEKRYGQRLLAIVPFAEPLPSFLWRH